MKRDFLQFDVSFLHTRRSPELVMRKNHCFVQKCEKEFLAWTNRRLLL